MNFKFKPSLFNRPRRSPLGSSVSASSAPTIANPATPADGASKFKAADAGDYRYSVSAVYSDGETLPSSESAAVTVAAGDKVTIEITYAGSPLYFNVFRDGKDEGSGSEKRSTKRVAPQGSGSAHDIDFNEKKPGSSSAYLLMHDPDVLSWKQLGSLIKYDLAVTNTSYQWLQLLYGMIVIQAPRKNVIIENLDLPEKS